MSRAGSSLPRTRSWSELGARACGPAFHGGVADKALESLDFGCGNGLAKPRHLVDTTPLVVVLWRLDLFDQPVRQPPLNRAVERPGSQLDGAVAQVVHAPHDRVPV